MKRYLLIILFSIPLTKNIQAQAKKDYRADNERSDTLDILHTTISLDITDFTTDTLRGNCEIQFKSKIDGVAQMLLDLLNMKVDSVKQNNQLISFTYTSPLLKIDLLNALMTGDSTAVTVYYHGRPVKDPFFGGFEFDHSGKYAFNIGVAFNDTPHPFGRAWFPCFDNFVERCTFDFHITTSDTMMASCNGELINSIDNGNGTKTWNWYFDKQIPSYLACTAVGNFITVKDTFSGMNGPMPVALFAVKSDTVKLKKSFAHLPNAFSIYENKFGLYQWNKIGYSIISFSAGGMEHATNIGYARGLVTGDLAYESLMAHELSHHWFGDLVTCRTEGDMWLNEGWARYAEHVFFEGVYGHVRYVSEVASNHEKTVHYAHKVDYGYRALSGIPTAYTYGMTVYDKGGDVAHTLRAYMGDALFFHCVKNYLSDNAFTDQDSYSFRDYLSTCSGINLTDFFDDWVFSPGFPHFSIDSFEVSPNGNWFDVTVHIRQKLDHAPHYYRNVPLEITFMNNEREKVTTKIMASGPCTVYKAAIPINPVFACTDLEEKISDAISDNYYTIKSTGTRNFIYGKMNLTVQSVTDSAFIRIEHNFVAPDPMKHPIPNLHLSQERYWRVDGIITDGFNAKATISYNGDDPVIPSTSSGAYLDAELLYKQKEDSLVLMYRPKVSADWQIETDAVLNKGSSNTDKRGTFTINHLKKGEYAFAIYQQNKIDSVLIIPTDTCQTIVSANTPQKPTDNILIYPNPSGNTFIIEGNFIEHSSADVFNLMGEKIYHCDIEKGFFHKRIKADNWGQGVFLIKIRNDNQSVTIRKQVIIK